MSEDLITAAGTTAASASGEQDFMLSSLAPSVAQKRLALALVLVSLVAFFVTTAFLSAIKLPRIDPFIPMYAATMFVNDSITAVLLFAQFSILRSRALLAISGGYLFTALMLIPWTLTFPGVFTPGGLLGAGLQSTVSLYILWHAGFPAFVIGYALLKEDDPDKRLRHGSVRGAIFATVAVITALVCAATVLVTAGHDRLPHIMLDTVRLSRAWSYAAGFILLFSVVALGLLWARGRSVLDLCLIVVMCAFALEICLISFPVPARFSVGWYAGRVFGALSGSLVLLVLLYEITTLYARMLRAVMAQRRERDARLITGDAVSASIAHEVNQPLAAMITNANAGLRWIDRAAPDLHEAKSALERIVADGLRAGAVIRSIRAMFKKDASIRTSLDMNELIWEALALLRREFERYRVSFQAEPDEPLPRVRGDHGQLQQVLLNLLTNAIDSMAAKDGPRLLRVKSRVHDSGGVIVAVEDTGTGVEPKDVDRIFTPLFTTKSHGMGMGLSICRSIIEAHEGRLWATPKGPQGAVFQFVLPAESGREPDHQR
jgi:signal transduction histidine kinase